MILGGSILTQLFTTSFQMAEDAFFYSYKEQTKKDTQHIFLESGRAGDMHIAARNPLAVMQATDEGLLITWRSGQVEHVIGDALALAEEIVARYRFEALPDLPLFQGGAIGFISYDYAREIEKLPSLTTNDLQTPRIFFYLFDEWAVYDKAQQRVYLMGLQPLQSTKEQWQQAATTGLAQRKFTTAQASYAVIDDVPPTVSCTREEFASAVKQVQAYIQAGDVFQVNLSVRQSRPLAVEPIVLYEALRALNPSPYMAYIQHEDFAVVSGSPELLIERQNNKIATRPIGGTRLRGATVTEDQALEQELLTNEKECAEHIMLVDLERNDLGKVAQYGSVEVDELMVIERYSHVMHLVSNVRGTVEDQVSNTAILRAMFPGGTITGTPKIRTMEIIEELETYQRGLYTGSIGWLGFTGDMVFNIVIRTAYIKNKIAHIQAGAGIVIDSDPISEYEESLNKARAMWQAKALAEGQQ